VKAKKTIKLNFFICFSIFKPARWLSRRKNRKVHLETFFSKEMKQSNINFLLPALANLLMKQSIIIFLLPALANLQMYPASLNEFGWLPWTIYGNHIFYAEQDTIFKCSNSICTPILKSSSVTPHLIAFRLSFFSILDYQKKLFFWFDNGYEIIFALPSNVEGPRALLIGETFFYLQITDETSGINIYTWPNSAQSLSSLLTNFIPSQTTPWILLLDNLYSFSQNSSHTFLTKCNSDGRYFSWNVSLPLCNSGTDKKNLLVSGTSDLIYAFCGGSNIVTMLHINEGTITGYYPADHGSVLAIDAYKNFLFLHYSTGLVVQFDSDQNYVTSYSVPDKTLTRDNSFYARNGYIHFLICNRPDCSSVNITQIEIKEKYDKFKILYEKNNITWIPDVSIEISQGSNDVASLSATFTKSNNYLPVKLPSHVSPIMYSEDKSINFVFFSLGLNVVTGTCGEIFLHKISLKLSFEFTREEIISPKTDETLHPISDYASFVSSGTKGLYYVIHGGIDCNRQMVYSDVFIIDITSNSYKKLNQSFQYS
jgi:hypothetical protein